MKRRSFLGVLLAGGLAGCTGSGGSGSPESPTGGSPTPPPGTGTAVDPVDIGSREGVAFPDNNRPRTLVVANDSEQSWPVRVSLVAVDADRQLWSRERTLAPGDRIGLRLLTPASYDLTVAVDGGATEHVRVPVSVFDCNHATSTARIGSGGGVTTETVATEIACPPATLTGSSVSSSNGSCGGSDEATVEFGTTGITIDGQTVAPTPCHDAKLREATLSEGVLTVTVGTVSTDEACVKCIGTVPYEVHCGFDHDLPAEVVVRHRRRGETVEVARAYRGADAW